ncbi:hypothetical protein ACLB2K_005108 [Fragaria x ananassa]
MQTCFMAGDSPPSPAVAGRDNAVGISGKSSPVGAVAGGGDEICKNGQSPPPCAVGVECLLEDPSVPVAATEDKITVSAAVTGRSNGEPHRPNPTIHVPPWPTAEMYSFSSYPLSGVSVTSDVTSPNSPYHLNEALTTPLSNNEGSDPDPEFDLAPGSPVDVYSVDQFRMYEFTVRRCARGRAHDWTDCPYAHPGENARRRDPRKFHYSGSACPDFRKGHCKKGDSCEFSHGVFECWLHPARYRTQRCKDGTSCERRVCFFAHTPDQLRVLPQQSPCGSNSPPMSPMTRSVSRSLGSGSVSEMVASLRKVKSLPTSWNVQVGSVGSVGSPGFVSPRGSMLRTGDAEEGHLLTGSRFGVGRSDITPMNDDFRMYIGNAESQTGNYPPPLEMSGDNSHLVRLLEQHLRSNCFVILFVTWEILGIVFEIIYQESHIMPYFVIWIVCVTIVMYAERRLAMIEGGMANREQFAVYLRCFSFLLLELLQCWGIDQGNYVIVLKIILKVTGAVIGWWVVGVLQSYMDAFDGETGSRK